MALDAVVFPQCFYSSSSSFMPGGPSFWHHDGGFNEELGESFLQVTPSCSSLVQNFDDWDVDSSPETRDGVLQVVAAPVTGDQEAAAITSAGGGRKKRRRTKTCKNKEEVENQRMTHIAVERNRRKQMNEYLSALRSLMPSSYVQRGDQASIIGGAINFVKELEQLLQSLEAQKRAAGKSPDRTCGGSAPFSDFFTFPQYSSTAGKGEVAAENRPTVADVEVTMIESHANLKILSRKRSKQLLKMLVGLQNSHLTTLHLNVTTVDQMVLYSFSLKVEDDCRLTSADEIATAVYQMLVMIQEESELHRDQMNNS